MLVYLRAVFRSHCYTSYTLQTCLPQRNLQQQDLPTYCSIRYGQWSKHCFADIANQPRHNPKWLKKRRLKANESNLVHVTFTARWQTCSPVHINNVHLLGVSWRLLFLRSVRRLLVTANVIPSLQILVIQEDGILQRTLSWRSKCQVSRAASRQETYQAQIHIHKTEATGNDAHQNVLATWMEVKTLYKQKYSHMQSNTETNQDLWNITVGYGFHFRPRNPRMFPM
jgi:hypothetical protein